MKLLFDMFPVILFFAAFKIKGIFVATAVAIAASIVQICWVYLRKRKVEPMQWISLGVIVVFGGATLLLKNELFIKWKPTVLYALFATVLLVSDLFFRKNLIRTMLQKQVSLPDRVWKAMNWSWGMFFLVVACVNIYVAYHFSTSTWVNFKLFGIMGLMLAFIVVQGLFISRFAEEKKVPGQDQDTTEHSG